MYLTHINHQINHYSSYYREYVLITGYHTIIYHYTKVRLFLKSSSIFTFFLKTQLQNYKHPCRPYMLLIYSLSQ